MARNDSGIRVCILCGHSLEGRPHPDRFCSSLCQMVRETERNRAKERRRKRSGYKARKYARNAARYQTDPVYREQQRAKQHAKFLKQRDERMQIDPAFREKMERLRAWHDKKLWAFPPTLSPEERRRLEKREYRLHYLNTHPEAREREREKQRKQWLNSDYCKRMREYRREYDRRPEVIERRKREHAHKYEQERLDRLERATPASRARMERRYALKQERITVSAEEYRERRLAEKREREHTPRAHEQKYKRALFRRLRLKAIAKAVTELGLLDLTKLNEEIARMVVDQPTGA